MNKFRLKKNKDKLHIPVKVKLMWGHINKIQGRVSINMESNKDRKCGIKSRATRLWVDVLVKVLRCCFFHDGSRLKESSNTQTDGHWTMA